MKAITLWQPWASLCVIPRQVPCACGGTGSIVNTQDGGYAEACRCTGPRVPFKTIETRSWPAPKALIGQRIAIHAAKRPMRDDELQAIGFGIRHCIGYHRQARAGSDLTLDGKPVIEMPAPLGAVVGTAVLVDCVPMVHTTQPRNGRCLVVDPNGMVLHGDPLKPGLDVEDQRPFGLFEPGRWAWLLSDVERFAEPIPAVGRQGIWNWEQAS